MIDDIQLGVKAKQLVDAVETAGVLAKGADRLIVRAARALLHPRVQGQAARQGPLRRPRHQVDAGHGVASAHRIAGV